jgi:hypothetical protein
MNVDFNGETITQIKTKHAYYTALLNSNILKDFGENIQEYFCLMNYKLSPLDFTIALNKYLVELNDELIEIEEDKREKLSYEKTSELLQSNDTLNNTRVLSNRDDKNISKKESSQYINQIYGSKSININLNK